MLSDLETKRAIKKANRISIKNETKKRLERFNKEMEYKDQFDTLLINDNIQVAINDFITTINEITKGVN
jgi:guanylate kinase